MRKKSTPISLSRSLLHCKHDTAAHFMTVPMVPGTIHITLQPTHINYQLPKLPPVPSSTSTTVAYYIGTIYSNMLHETQATQDGSQSSKIYGTYPNLTI